MVGSLENAHVLTNQKHKVDTNASKGFELNGLSIKRNASCFMILSKNHLVMRRSEEVMTVLMAFHRVPSVTYRFDWRTYSRVCQTFSLTL